MIYCIFISLEKGSKKSEIKEFFSKNIYVYILLPKYVHFKLKSALKKEHNSDLIYIWSIITTGNKNCFLQVPDFEIKSIWLHYRNFRCLTILGSNSISVLYFICIPLHRYCTKIRKNMPFPKIATNTVLIFSIFWNSAVLKYCTIFLNIASSMCWVKVRWTFF